MSTLLLVEDDAADADLAREALAGRALGADLHVVADGFQALAFLRREGSYADAPTPGLVLLDLNMPRLDGRGMLADLKGDSVLRAIPVIVFSSSGAPQDVAAAYGLYANCYVRKPVHLAEYVSVIQAIVRFWTGVALLPHAAPLRV